MMTTTIYTEFHGGHVAIIGGDTTSFLSFLSFFVFCSLSLLSSVSIWTHFVALHLVRYSGWFPRMGFGYCFWLDVSCVFFCVFLFFFFLVSLGLYGVGVGFRGCKKTRTKRDCER